MKAGEIRTWNRGWCANRVSAGVQWDTEYMGVAVGAQLSPRYGTIPPDLRLHLWVGPVTFVAHVEIGRRRAVRWS